MKRLTGFLAAVVATSLMGCQESNFTGPSATAMRTPDAVSKSALSDNTDIIILQASINDANEGDQYSVTGRVKFGLTKLPIMSQELFDVVLDTEAKVKPLGSTPGGWAVSNNSLERVNLTYQTSGTVDKWYFLQGGPNSMYLHVRFDVTATTVSVNAISIE
jgi:hypothetical protein